MPQGARDIKRKIKSVKNTRQITKAMELVAASKMRRAVESTLALRPYAHLAQLLLKRLAQAAEGSEAVESSLHPLLTERPVKSVLAVIISTDKGLCGGLNTQLFRQIRDYLKTEDKKKLTPEVSFVAIGRKAQEFLHRQGKHVVAAYPALSNNPLVADTYPISRMVIDDYAKATYDKVILIYTDFKSALSQSPLLRRLLPLSQSALEEMVDGLESHIVEQPKGAKPLAGPENGAEYAFEPSPHEVLAMLLPRLTEMQVYQAVLEATASEHAARMFAMRNASDNAKELMEDLTLTYNGIRQAAITAELAEISAGRAALE